MWASSEPNQPLLLRKWKLLLIGTLKLVRSVGHGGAHL